MQTSRSIRSLIYVTDQDKYSRLWFRQRRLYKTGSAPEATMLESHNIFRRRWKRFTSF